MMKPGIRQILLTIVLVLAVFGVLHTSVQSFEVDGSSMDDNFHDGQYLIVEKVSYRFSSPDRGDVIIFDHPVTQDKLLIKRVIGLPGEKVEIKEGKIYIDGYLLEETSDFGSSISYSTSYSVRVPDDNYFVLGDNRAISGDSLSEHWTVPRDEIIGRVWIRYWPLGDWGLSPGYSWDLS